MGEWLGWWPSPFVPPRSCAGCPRLGAPEVGFGGFVVFSEKADDRVGQFADRGEALLGDEVGKIAKEAFDQVEPGRGGGSEVHVEAGMLGQPPLHLGVLVGGVIVDDQMDVETGRGLAVDALEEGKPLLVAVA